MSIIVNKVSQQTVIVNKGPKGDPGDGVRFYGQIFTQTTQTVAIATTNEYVDLSITGTFDTLKSSGTDASENVTFGIKNTSGESSLFMVIASVDVGIGNNRTAGLRLAVNGTSLPETTCTATTGIQNFAKLMSHFIVELHVGDEVSLAIANETGTQDIDVHRAKLVAFSLG